VRVSHRQLIILNTPNQWLGVFFYMGNQNIMEGLCYKQ